MMNWTVEVGQARIKFKVRKKCKVVRKNASVGLSPSSPLCFFNLCLFVCAHVCECRYVLVGSEDKSWVLVLAFQLVWDKVSCSLLHRPGFLAGEFPRFIHLLSWHRRMGIVDVPTATSFTLALGNWAQILTLIERVLYYWASSPVWTVSWFFCCCFWGAGMRRGLTL